MSARTVMRGVAFLGATALLASMTMAPAASAAPLPASAPLPSSAPQATLEASAAAVTPPAREVTPRGFWALGVMDVLSLGFDAYSEISNCIANQKADKTCTSKIDLNDIDKRLDAIEEQIKTNQKETVGLLHDIQTTVNSIASQQHAKTLEPIEANIPALLLAWEEIQKCQVKAQTSINATCESYTGKKGSSEPAELAMKKTLDWMNDPASGPLTGLSTLVSETTLAFDKFSAAMWKQIKDRYDQKVGYSSATATGDKLRPRILTHGLTEVSNKVFKEWVGQMLAYGFFLPMKTGATEATRTAVDSYIFGKITPPGGAKTVLSISDFYQLPEVPAHSVVFLKGGKAYKIKNPKTPAPPLTPDDMFNLGRDIQASGYTASRVLSKEAMTFVVERAIFERAHPYYTNGKTGLKVAVCASWFGAGGCGEGDAPRTRTHELRDCTPGQAGALAGHK